jgi:hypothetical protein
MQEFYQKALELKPPMDSRDLLEALSFLGMIP